MAATLSACTTASGDHTDSRTEGTLNPDQLAAISHGTALDASINCNGKTGMSAPDFMVPGDFATIQDAIDAASDGDTICVEAGAYYENINFDSKKISVIGARGPHFTAIDGGGAGSVVTMEGTEDEDSILNGFTIRNGYAEYGAGFYLYEADPTLINLIVRNNEATEEGGGLDAYYSAYTMRNVLFQNNVAGSCGGAVSGYLNGGTMDNVSVVSNFANSGGGLCLWWGGIDMNNMKILGNEAVYNGGGIWSGWDQTEVINGVIMGNSANYGGAIYSGEASSITVINTIITDNAATTSGSGIAMDYANYGNFHQENSNMYNDDCVDGWYYCPTFSYEEDPEFVDTSDADPLNWDLHLASSSLLIDVGDSSLSDPDGSPSDMGAYGGSGAKGWNLDGDGFFEWWQVGEYDSAYVKRDCDDLNPTVNPNSGC
jgi:hypothetical protein